MRSPLGSPTRTALCGKHHICVFCWDDVLAWLYGDADVVLRPHLSKVPPTNCTCHTIQSADPRRHFREVRAEHSKV